MSIEICLRTFTDSEILGSGEMRSIRSDVISALKKQLGIAPAWEEGKSVGEESLPLGGFEALTQLQRYASHIDLAGSPPAMPGEDNSLYDDEWLQEYWEAAESEDAIDKPLRFKHLIWTGSLGIFYIPIEFPDPLLIEEGFEDEEQTEEIEYISVGSSPQLLRELDDVNKWLMLQGDYGDVGKQVAKEVFDNEQDLWREVKWAWLVLHWMARKSLEKKLTLCFE